MDITPFVLPQNFVSEIKLTLEKIQDIVESKYPGDQNIVQMVDKIGELEEEIIKSTGKDPETFMTENDTDEVDLILLQTILNITTAVLKVLKDTEDISDTLSNLEDIYEQETEHIKQRLEEEKTQITQELEIERKEFSERAIHLIDELLISITAVIDGCSNNIWRKEKYFDISEELDTPHIAYVIKYLEHNHQTMSRLYWTNKLQVFWFSPRRNSVEFLLGLQAIMNPHETKHIIEQFCSQNNDILV